jgi:hypothetical protein
MPSSDSRRLPGWAFGVLVVLTAVITTVSLSTVWLKRTVLDTDTFVERIGPVVDDPAVASALGDFVANEVVALVDLRGFLEGVLPDAGDVLAPVLSNAVRGFLAEEAAAFFATDEFQTLWEETLRVAHSAAMKVLEGGGDTVSTVDGRVVLNLVPVINEILERVGDRIAGFVGQDIEIPDIDPSAPPGDVRRQLEAAFGVTIPEDFGQIEVFNSDTLDAAQLAVEWFDKGAVVLVILAVVLLALTVVFAPDRRRGAMWVALGVAASTVLVRRVVFATQDEITRKAKTEANRDAVRAVVDEIFSSYLTATVVVIVVSLLIWLVAFAFGPSRAAEAVRGAGDTDWIRENVSVLRGAVIAAAAALVLFTDLGFFALLIVGIVVGLLLAWLAMVARREPAPSAPPS